MPMRNGFRWPIPRSGTPSGRRKLRCCTADLVVQMLPESEDAWYYVLRTQHAPQPSLTGSKDAVGVVHVGVVCADSTYIN